MLITLPNTFRDAIAAIGIKVHVDPDMELSKRDFDVNLRDLDETKINKIYKLTLEHMDGQYKDATRPIRSSINSYKAMRTDEQGKGATFRELANAIRTYIVKDATEGWLYQLSGEPRPALVTEVEYHPATKNRDGSVNPAYITIDLQRNDRGKLKRETINIAKYNEGKSAGEVLIGLGWQKETPELFELYTEQLERYEEIRPMYGKQLKMTQTVMWREKTQRRYSYYDDDRSDMQQDLAKLGGGRLVHDDKIPEGVFQASTRAKFDDPDNPSIDPLLMAEIKKVLPADTRAFSRSPYTLMTRVFHLGAHQNFDLHVMQVEIYKYDKEMRNKLVLSDMYSSALDVLTDDMTLVQEDIVEGKTGGNIILLAGMPGLGKTLTAEVYAEFREVPLYKIHSGQLGTSPESIEKKLMEVYKRASDWGCPFLIDEFDVFGRARGDNLIQNAVVAVFLRTLEYQNNTGFLTTNRSKDMDDAILSRCSAIIDFNPPEPEELKRIWQVQRAQILPSVKDETIDQLMEFFTLKGKKMSGRDVKNTLQLADRWVKSKNVEPDLELLKTCAAFRGI